MRRLDAFPRFCQLQAVTNIWKFEKAGSSRGRLFLNLKFGKMRISSLFTAFACAASLHVAAPVQAQVTAQPDMSQQARVVVDDMQARSFSTLVVMDKARAEILVVDQGRVVMRSPALYGKGVGEDEGADKNVTPAGVFALREYRDRHYDGGRVLAFLCRPGMCYIIHPTWNGVPAEQRNRRLASPAVEDNAISNGCINVPFDFYQRMSNYLQSKAMTVGSMVTLPRLVVLPENQDVDATRRILGLTTSVAQTSQPNP